MTVALVGLTVVAALVLGGAGAAKVVAVPAMQQRAEHLGFSVTAYRSIGLLELAGVVGLVLGLVVPATGVAAAAGLALMMVGAVISHLRAGDRFTEAVPAIAVGTLVAVLLALTVKSW